MPKIEGHAKYMYPRLPKGQEILFWMLYNINLLLAECEVRTASYGPSFFLPFISGPSAKRAGHESKEGKNEDP